jgi:hypothetical protein
MRLAQTDPLIPANPEARTMIDYENRYSQVFLKGIAYGIVSTRKLLTQCTAQKAPMDTSSGTFEPATGEVAPKAAVPSIKRCLAIPGKPHSPNTHTVQEVCYLRDLSNDVTL